MASMEHSSSGASFFASLRRSGVRRAEHRWFGGVASGYAERMGIDPLLVRTAFIVLAFFGGFGLVLYGISWMLLPEAADGRIHLQEALAGRFDGALALAGAITLCGFLIGVIFLQVIPAYSFPIAWLFTLVIYGLILSGVGLLVAFVVALVRRSSTRPAARPAPPGDDDAPVTDAAGLAPPEPEQPTGGKAPPLFSAAREPFRRRTPGPGRRMIALSLAATLLSVAAGLAAWQYGLSTFVYPPVAIAGLILCALGLIIVVLGLIGRRAGVINLLALGALLTGGLLSALTFDTAAPPGLAWSAEAQHSSSLTIWVTSVAQLQGVDWDLPPEIHHVHIELAELPAAELTGGATAQIRLPGNLGVSIAAPGDLPLVLRVSGTGAQVMGEFHGGVLTSEGAVGTMHEGFSLSSGGWVRYQHQLVDDALTLDIHAPHSWLTFGYWY